jgi:hypothetical protein
MTKPVDNLLFEQLSAFMDGELPEAEARFLQRRLEHDAELRGQWSRMQVAASCLKGQDWRPMAERLCGQVAGAVAEATPARRQRPLLRWAMAASVAALAVLFAPRLMHSADTASDVAIAIPAASAPDRTLASPASADLVAVRSPAAVAPAAQAPTPAAAPGADLLAAAAPAPARETPLPLDVQSPSEFPLLANGDKRAWPKSEMLGAGSDPALEAYLVRHNQMLANDGLGGFVPYVDVVARDQTGVAPPADSAADNLGDDPR